jgi:CheY-like chemotaxis protein
MHVLIVEDDKVLGREISDFLTQANHESDWVLHGTGALKLLELQRYDAVVSDVQMPGRLNDGISLLQGAWRTLEEPIPFCVHSSEDTFFFYDRTWDLPIDIPKFFKLAEFHNKKKEDWRTYIPEFLKGIKT